MSGAGDFQFISRLHSPLQSATAWGVDTPPRSSGAPRTPSSPSRSCELTNLRPAAEPIRAGRFSRLHHKGQRKASPRLRLNTIGPLRTFQVAAGLLQALSFIRELHRDASQGRPDEVN